MIVMESLTLFYLWVYLDIHFDAIQEVSCCLNNAWEEELSGGVRVEVVDSQKARVLVQTQHRGLTYVMACVGGWRCALLQEDVKTVQEVMQGSTHHSEHVIIFFIAVTEYLSTESELQGVQGNSCDLQKYVRIIIYAS